MQRFFLACIGQIDCFVNVDRVESALLIVEILESPPEFLTLASFTRCPRDLLRLPK